MSFVKFILLIIYEYSAYYKSIFEVQQCRWIKSTPECRGVKKHFIKKYNQLIPNLNSTEVHCYRVPFSPEKMLADIYLLALHPYQFFN